MKCSYSKQDSNGFKHGYRGEGFIIVCTMNLSKTFSDQSPLVVQPKSILGFLAWNPFQISWPQAISQSLDSTLLLDKSWAHLDLQE
ncbi:hypothetical protein V6N12_010096 [Hibiscus sabdariffa]|uniref:Uncharacterized protein n=1 Tax=Hibiscus sabdariffa TaxID=183260 RepID=A0ABR2ECP5_9ROSI